MGEAIYFTKVEFREKTIFPLYPEKRILINLPMQELSFQKIGYKIEDSAMYVRNSINLANEDRIDGDIGYVIKVLCNEKTGFKSQFIPSDKFEERVVFSYGINLTSEQMKELLPYCNALDFEPYRARKMRMGNEEYVDYLDGVSVSFRAITDSYLPMIELQLERHYDEAHIWPSEKLYEYIIKTYVEGNKKLKKWK